jgi:hypothetical protein
MTRISGWCRTCSIDLRQRQVPEPGAGGLQDNGTRVRTDSGGTFNQSFGGDGLGAAYSQDNTNSVFASATGSSMRVNLSNNPREVIRNS